MSTFMNYYQAVSVSPGALGGSLAQVALTPTVAVYHGVLVTVDALVQLSGTPGSQVNLQLVETVSATAIALSETILPDSTAGGGTAIMTMGCRGVFTVPGSSGTTNIAWQLNASTAGTCSIGASSGILLAISLV